MNKPKVVITHHAVSLPTHTVKDVDMWHKARWPKFKSERGYWVGYHYVIERGGEITQTRNLWEEGAHTIGMNKSSIGVCFMGNFDRSVPTASQMSSWYQLYKELRTKYPDIPTRPHRAYANKSCHGKMLSDDHFTFEKQIYTLQMELKRLLVLLLSLLKKK